MTPIHEAAVEAALQALANSWHVQFKMSGSPRKWDNDLPEKDRATTFEGMRAALEAAAPLIAPPDGAVEAAVLAERWQPIETAPKDGQIIWAWLNQSGIRAIQWVSAEETAEEIGGLPEDYDPVWAEVDHHAEQWEPKWWLPYVAISEPPPEPPRSASPKPGSGE